MSIRIEIIDDLFKFMSFLSFTLSPFLISFDDKKVLGKIDAKKFAKLTLALMYLMNIKMVALFLYYNGSIDFYKLLNRNIFEFGYFFILIFELFTCVGEDYGWRYFLQGRLQECFGKIKGILMIGIIWGVYHVPLYLSTGITEGHLYSLIYIVFTCI